MTDSAQKGFGPESEASQAALEKFFSQFAAVNAVRMRRIDTTKEFKVYLYERRRARVLTRVLHTLRAPSLSSSKMRRRPRPFSSWIPPQNGKITTSK